jgi:hypothetical protein
VAGGAGAAIGLVEVDRAVLQRQKAVCTVDPAAQGGARGVDLVSSIKEAVIVALPPVMLMPPPVDVAWFLVILLEATVSVQ